MDVKLCARTLAADWMKTRSATGKVSTLLAASAIGAGASREADATVTAKRFCFNITKGVAARCLFGTPQKGDTIKVRNTPSQCGAKPSFQAAIYLPRIQWRLNWQAAVIMDGPPLTCQRCEGSGDGKDHRHGAD